MTKIDTAYLNLLQAIVETPAPFRKQEPLVAHYPMRGKAEQVDVIFVGRALNGWTHKFTVANLEHDVEKKFKEIKKNFVTEEYPEREQLLWVENRNATHKHYNSNKSQFWQTIREVMGVRKKAKEEWWHGIVWTNFQPLSRDGDNPTAGMVSVMGDATMNLLLAQIEEYQPRHIVCLSGMEYAANLLARCERTTRLPGTENSRYVEYAGLVDFPGKQNVGFVIMPHPQGRGKSRELMVSEITTQLNRMDQLTTTRE